MDLLTSDKSPVLLTLLLAILTWQAGEIVATLQSGHPLLYEITIDRRGTDERSQNVARLSIENVSQSAALKDFEFLMVCPHKSDCFAGKDAQIVAIPPTFTRDITVRSGKSYVGVKGTLAAGGELVVEDELSRNVEDLTAMFVIDPQNPSNALALRKSTLRGFMLRHYFTILVVSGLLVAAVLSVWIMRALIRELWPKTPGKPPSESATAKTTTDHEKAEKGAAAKV